MADEEAAAGAVEAEPEVAAEETPAGIEPDASVEGAEATEDAAGIEPDGEEAAPEEKPEQESASAEGPPESYEEFTVPDELVVSEAEWSGVTDFFKELGLSQADAQKVVDYQAQRTVEASRQAADQIRETQEGWAKDLVDDPDIGGDKLAPAMGMVNALVKTHGKEFGIGNLLNQMGVQQHPGIIKFLHKIANELGEDALGLDSEGSGKGKDTRGFDDFYSKPQTVGAAVAQE